MRHLIAPLAVACALALAPVGARTATAAPAPPPLTVQLEDSPDLGRVLADPQGHTLYRYDLDTGTGIACTGECIRTRPPFPYHSGEVLALPPGIAGTLGEVHRPDGTEQITYDGEPLYTYTGDHFSGDTNGNGGHWHAIQPPNAPGH